MTQDQQNIIRDAELHLRRLNEWEKDFIIRLSGLRPSIDLSEKQDATLNKIAKKIERANAV